MKNALKALTGQPKSNANVVDGKLILSLPQAKNPIVWQMDLNEARSSALEVRTEKDGEGFTLILKTNADKSTDIAPFDNRNDAVNSLMAAAKALESAHGQINTVPQGTTYAPAPRKKRGWVPVVLGLLILFGLFSIWASMAPKNTNGQFPTLSATSGNGQSAQSSQQLDAVGVAVSADDFLRAR